MAGRGSAPGERKGGRQAGVPNKVNAATRERIEKDADPIGLLCRIANGEPIEASPTKDGEEAQTLRPTLDQRMSAAQTLARKVQPDAKDRTVQFGLPAIETVADTIKALGAILAAVAAGNITPAEGQQVASVVESYRRAIETVDLESRIAALEQRRA